MANATAKDVKILGTDGTTWYSLTGPQGPPGPALNIKDSVATEAALKALSTGNTKGDARIVEKTGDLWVWDGTKWVKTSHLKGDQGIPGRSIHVFPQAAEPNKAADPNKPETEPDKAHVGDIWIVPEP